MRRPGFSLLIGVLFFVSGFTGLIYEVIWAKYLALLLGSTAYAQVGVLAVFMGGLAVGSIAWGSMVDRAARPLALYGVLEVGIGVCAAAFAGGFDLLGRGYWSLLAAVGNTGVVAGALKAALCIGAMFPPTFCMGGTLPVLSRALGLGRRNLGRGVAYLYALNSFGAVLGAVITGFYLVATWGFDTPFLGAALVNGLVGAVAIAVAFRQPALKEVDEWGPSVEKGRSGGNLVGSSHQSPSIPLFQRGQELAKAENRHVQEEKNEYETAAVRSYLPLVLVGATVSGAVAMIDEVAWIRLCSLVLGSSTYAFAIMLAAFIAGIAGGSLTYTLIDPARRRPLRFFAYSSLLAAATLLLCLPLYDRLPYFLGRLTALLGQYNASFAAYQLTSSLFCLAVMLPLTFVSGLNFPALSHAAGQAREGVGGPVSRVLFANTAGTIGGAVLGGLYLLPAAGLRGMFLLGAGATVAVAALILSCDRSLGPRWRRGIVAASIGGFAAYAAAMPRWNERLLVAGEFRRHEGITAQSFAAYRATMTQPLVFYRDGINATVSVERQWPQDMVLRVNGKADASGVGDADTELLSGHLPAVLHAAARRVLVIGYGSGMTVGALLQHPVQSVDVVEISPEVIAADEYFRPYNHDPLHNPRTHLYVEDARTFLYRVTGRYDLIISEPSNPWIAGIGNLFTQEFFEQAHARLAPDGLLVQWFHTYETTDRIVALILRTVSRVFAEVRVFQPNRWDTFVVAAPGPRAVNPATMREAFTHAADLRSIGVNRLATLLALEVLPPGLTRELAGDGPCNRDRFPVLEYAAPRAFFENREATMLSNADPWESDDFVLKPTALTLEEYRDAGGYLERAELMSYTGALRLLSNWLAHDPTEPGVLNVLTNWMARHPDSPALLPALTRAQLAEDPALRYEYARLLLRVVASLHLTPQAQDITSVAPMVREVAQQLPNGTALLRQLDDLTAAAAARRPADGG
jgi:spermidine synthase